MYTLLMWLPRLVLLVLAGVLALYGVIWLPIVLVVMVAFGLGLPRVL